MSSSRRQLNPRLVPFRVRSIRWLATAALGAVVCAPGCAGQAKRTAAELRLERDGLRVQVVALQKRITDLQAEHAQALGMSRDQLATMRQSESRLRQEGRLAMGRLEQQRVKFAAARAKEKALREEIATLRRQIAILQTRRQLERKKLQDRIKALEKGLSPRANPAQ